MSVRLVAIHDYKYAPGVWRGDIAETFQKAKQVKTDFTVVDGQVVRTRETTWAWASALAAKTPQIPEPPATFLYAVDATSGVTTAGGSYRANPTYIFQKVLIRTTTYSAYGDGAYLVHVATYDVLTGITTYTSSIVDGKIPLSPTVNSALSNLIQQPVVGVLDDNCDSIPTTTVIGDAYIEDNDDAAKVARRRMQRETAIVRRVKHAANPLMRLGHTIRLVDDKRGLDARHVLTGKSVTIDAEGGADEVLELEFWGR